MPLYSFEHSDTGEIRDIFFSMNDVKVYNGKDGTEINKWHRVYHIPQASFNTKIDPFSQKDFVNKLDNKNYTYGELWDSSAELSEKRANTLGEDPVKQKFYADYAKKRKGRRHRQEVLEKKEKKMNDALKTAERSGISIKLNH